MQRISLTPQLTVFQSRFEAMNSGLITCPGGGVILIDPGVFPDELAELVWAVGEQPVLLLALTHAHWDHVVGLTTWPHAPCLASAACADLEDLAAVLRDEIAQAEALYGVRWEPPVEWLTPQRLIRAREPLHDSLLGWEAFPAPGHSPDMLALYDSAAHTLWAGDMFSDREPPLLQPGTTGAYLATLETLGRLPIDRLVPGHGSIADGLDAVRSRFDADRAYLFELRGRVQSALRAGQTLDYARAACADMRFPNAESLQTQHNNNVAMVWAELDGPPKSPADK
jgi:glyoxylase-like metal-dependent hydrolase (beta-lactamase superfamily II)